MSTRSLADADEPAALAPLSRTNVSTGRIYFWPGASLWIGHGSGHTQWHEHHAHQVCVVAQGSVRFRGAARGSWTDFEGAFVPSHCTHQFEVLAVPMAHLFVEPESSAGRALAQRFGAQDLGCLPAEASRAAAQHLYAAFHSNPEHGHMVEVATRVLADLCGAATRPDQAADRRLATALAYMRANVDKPLTLGDVAGSVALSESRFRHLFVEATGCPFRVYLLWLRINRAIEAAMAGASWTEAAHAAGFADSAHLSRTHKRMFGIEPSAIRPQALEMSGRGGEQ